MNKRSRNIFIFLLAGLFYFTVVGIFNAIDNNDNEVNSKIFKIISSSENEVLENDIKKYAEKENININIEYADTLDIMAKINAGGDYDAVWSSNSIWLYLVDGSVASITNSKSTSINPVIFGIKKSKAESLGFVGKDVYTNDIVEKIANKELKFAMSNPTSTNSGASAYLGILSTLAGNPEVLTSDILSNSELKSKLKTFFSGLERTSGNEDFLEELFLKGDYEAVVAYESSIINMNKKLISSGKEPLYAIYPVDGVSISDSTFAYIDKKDESKKEDFLNLQSYLLSDKGQELLAGYGRRTWYGGINSDVDKSIFNPDWGIDTTKYITPVKYPSTDVIKEAIGIYQIELRKPVHVVFCLDYSGSMYSTGIYELRNAMKYILSEEASRDFIQFSSEDKIDVIPFSNYAGETWSTENGTQTTDLLNQINNKSPEGGTALYPAVQNALELLLGEDKEKYNTSVILMTDGMANVGSYYDLHYTYDRINQDIPVYSIMFGNADESELNKIAALTNGKVFDGKTNLVEAFKSVRGYN